MTLRRVPAFTMIAIVGLGVQAGAQAPCLELVRLRNAANNNHESCDISVPLLNQVEGYHREAVQARDNACAGCPLRPFPADIIQR
jgi:hypothetical protein